MKIENFDKYMAIIKLVPYKDRFGFKFQTNINDKVFLQDYDQFNFTPWKMMRDNFGGIVFVNESINIYEYRQPICIRKELFGKFIKDPRYDYQTNSISWFGFFKNIFSINKEYKNFKKNIISYLDQQNLKDEQLREQILNFQFQK